MSFFVLQHRHVGPEMMLDLVVEKAMHEIIEVRTGGVIDRAGDLPDIEIFFSGHAGFETREIITGMICHNDEKSMKIGNPLRDHHI